MVSLSTSYLFFDVLTRFCNNIDSNPQLQMPFESYPEPHRSPRLASMEDLCWEIKWEHRDDCVSALMVNFISLSRVTRLIHLKTLRRVPHLTVTWAHQPNTSGQGLNPPGHRHLFQSYTPHNRHRPFTHQSFVPHRVHISRFQQLTVPGGTVNDHVKAHCVAPVGSATHDHDIPEATHESWADESGSTATRKEINSSKVGEGGNDTSIILDQLPPIDRFAPVPDTANGLDGQKKMSKDEQESSKSPDTAR